MCNCMQALEKWGNWGEIAPGISNGQSEIKFTQLEFARSQAVASQFEPDEGYTGLIQVGAQQQLSQGSQLQHLQSKAALTAVTCWGQAPEQPQGFDQQDISALNHACLG